MTWAAFARTAYKAARSWGIQPSEFWTMTPAEWWAELDTKIVEDRAMRKGNAPGVQWSAAEIEAVKAFKKK